MPPRIEPKPTRFQRDFAAAFEAAKKRGLTQSEVARRAGMDHAYLHRVLNGLIVPNVIQAERLMTALGHRVNWRGRKARKAEKAPAS